jgi:protein SCO1/2
MKRRWLQAAMGLLLLLPILARAAVDLQVATTIKPVHSILSGLLKDIGEPGLLIPEGRTPFDFEPDDATREALARTTLLFWVGPELEKTLQPLIAGLPESVRVVELLSRKDLKVLPSRANPEQRNPFFWMDDRNAIILLDLLTEILIEVDPARSHIYSRNRLRLLKPLKRIDREYEYGYRGLQAGTGAEYYDALHYFEQAYALKIVGHVATTPWDPVDTEALLRLRGRMLEFRANCLFTERGMPAANLDLLTAGQEIAIGELDPLGLQFEPGEALYLELMRHNTDVIKQCLRANMDEAALARAQADEAVIPETDGIGGRFMLTDQLGDLVTEQDFVGKWSLVYFGYTHCPDVCPTTLSTLTRALKLLGDKARDIQPYFISVDPDRDKPPVIREYVRYFDPRLKGLTGTPAMIQRLADQFGVRFEKGEVDPENPELYAMDHSASLFLMAPDGRFVTKFAYGISAETLADKLREYIR